MSDKESSRGLVESNSAAYAIADAMMGVQRYFLSPAEGSNLSAEFPVQRAPIEEIETLLQKRSKLKCRQGALFSAGFLLNRYQDLFPHFFMLRSENAVNFFNDGDFGYHHYLLLGDRVGRWYAVSPANHDPDSADSPLTRILSANSVEGIVDAAGEVYGGEWPSSQFVNELIISGRYKPPLVDSFQESRIFGTGMNIKVTSLEVNYGELSTDHVWYRVPGVDLFLRQ